MLARGQGSCSQRPSSPPQPGSLQSHFHIHVLAAVVCDDDVEMRVASDLGQALHVSDELLHPASLVLHYAGRSSRENTAKLGKRKHPSALPEVRSPIYLCQEIMHTIGIISMKHKDLRASAWAFYSLPNTSQTNWETALGGPHGSNPTQF